ncbi:DUF2510 domain-containing protein [Streptomyces sp. SM12]|uniref:DUF2510 domain-containing protein n=1 Tax=Streptomyces sp. SM12 TaxID=1071602 RepID=UPI000CD50148|nr:DUF2510 domain-containing protein [Streptomyces sp. SM12]
MTMPPGWYPDPGFAGNGPAPERWWDGTNWTGQTRDTAAGDAPAAPDPPATDVPAPGEDPASGTKDAGAAGTASRRRTAAVAGGAALTAALVIAALLMGGTTAPDDSAADPADRTGESTDGADEDTGSDDDAEDENRPDGDEPPAAGTDFTRWTSTGLAGATLPVPDGWTERSIDGVSVTDAEYPCPNDSERTCVRAGAFMIPGGAESDPRAAAHRDVIEHTEVSFPDDAYGGITDHREELSEEVAVAGTTGHRVRRWLETGAGTQAYAETVAFPAPDGSGTMLLLRLGWSADADGPGQPLMEALVEGVRPATGETPGTDV